MLPKDTEKISQHFKLRNVAGYCFISSGAELRLEFHYLRISTDINPYRDTWYALAHTITVLPGNLINIIDSYP